jgi:hypothetical protein
MGDDMIRLIVDSKPLKFRIGEPTVIYLKSFFIGFQTNWIVD